MYFFTEKNSLGQRKSRKDISSLFPKKCEIITLFSTTKKVLEKPEMNQNNTYKKD